MMGMYGKRLEHEDCDGYEMKLEMPMGVVAMGMAMLNMVMLVMAIMMTMVKVVVVVMVMVLTTNYVMGIPFSISPKAIAWLVALGLGVMNADIDTDDNNR